MAKSRSSKSLLAAACDQSSQPIYWLDERLRLRYINAAMAQWLDWGDQPLPDTAMTFGSATLALATDSGPNGVNLLTTGARRFPADLAPPPEHLGHESISAWVCRQRSEHQPPLTARAWFMPLAGPKSPAGQGWLVKLDPDIQYTVSETPTEESPGAGSSHNRSQAPWAEPLAPSGIQTLLLQSRGTEQHAVPVLHAAGNSAAARRLRKQIELATQVSMPLLVCGPAGTGRESIVRHVFAKRQQHLRLHQPLLVPLDCRLADPELVQETWRHVLRTAGSEPPHLLLVNVDQLSEASALELLGLLQLPHSRVIPLSTATAQLPGSPWHQLPSELQMALSCQVIELPRLQERLSDIPALTQVLLESLPRTETSLATGLAPAAMQVLLDYDWPGNTEQLQHAIAECLQHCPQPLVEVAHLPKAIVYAVQAKRQSRVGVTEIELEPFLESIERQLIERALSQARFNRAAAARLLHISRAKLLRRCEQLSIAFPAEPVEFILDEDESGNDSDT